MFGGCDKKVKKDSDGGFGSDGIDRSVAREDALFNLIVTPSTLFDQHMIR